MKTTCALVDVWQASETSHSKSSLGNFQHQYLTELLVNVYSYSIVWWWKVYLAIVYMEGGFSQIWSHIILLSCHCLVQIVLCIPHAFLYKYIWAAYKHVNVKFVCLICVRIPAVHTWLCHKYGLLCIYIHCQQPKLIVLSPLTKMTAEFPVFLACSIST